MTVLSERWARRQCRRRLTIIAVCLLLLLAAAFIFRAPLLTAFARAWIIHEPLQKADALVILGGHMATRPQAAVDLYNQGLAPVVVHFDVRWEPGPIIGWDNSERELTKQILLQSGVPTNAVVTIGQSVSSSYEEAVAVHDWARTNQLKSLILVTDMFHTRRARWLYRKQLGDLNLHLQAAPIPHPKYRPDNWWQTEEGLVDFQQEWIKWPLYWIKY